MGPFGGIFSVLFRVKFSVSFLTILDAILGPFWLRLTGSAVSAVDVLFGNLLLEWEECRGGWHRRRAVYEAGGFIFS